jgi:glucose-1-phosphate cytidylyltransferase
MKVVILCGGKGTRMREETEYRPKPLVTIGGMPILWHIMKTYSYYGHKDFILCLGYKGEMIKDYFLKFEELANDFTLNLRSKHERVIHHSKANLEDWNITFVNTGNDSQTGSRVAKIKNFVGDSDDFFLTYGDGVANVNISDLLAFHKAHNKISTITAVRPPSRFGEIMANGKRVTVFNEKPTVSEGYINGGFFVFKNKLFDYLSVKDDCVLEKEPLETLAKKGEMMMYPHNGFWHCMDTYRDYLMLNDCWDEGKASWKVWE